MTMPPTSIFPFIYSLLPIFLTLAMITGAALISLQWLGWSESFVLGLYWLASRLDEPHFLVFWQCGSVLLSSLDSLNPCSCLSGRFCTACRDGWNYDLGKVELSPMSSEMTLPSMILASRLEFLVPSGVLGWSADAATAMGWVHNHCCGYINYLIHWSMSIIVLINSPSRLNSAKFKSLTAWSSPLSSHWSFRFS